MWGRVSHIPAPAYVKEKKMSRLKLLTGAVLGGIASLKVLGTRIGIGVLENRKIRQISRIQFSKRGAKRR